MIPGQLLEYIIRPTLARMGPEYNAPGADILLLATGAQETHCGKYVHQVGGPALGWPQVEPGTQKLVWKWGRRHTLHILRAKMAKPERLMTDWRLACMYARLVYYSWPDPLPPINCDAMFLYYKEKYNSPSGAATLEDWRKNWSRYVEPLLGDA